MKIEPELPADVLEQIHANRKIEAIKRLRLHHRIDLKDARDMVDAYIRANPGLIVRNPPRSETGLGRFILILIVIAVVFALYVFGG